MLLPFGCLLRKRRHRIGKYLIWWILNAEKYEKIDMIHEEEEK